jgi:hypothetical protein
VDMGEQRRETRDGDVPSKEVEFWDIPPRLSFRLKLRFLLVMPRAVCLFNFFLGPHTIETMKTLGAKALPVAEASAHSALPASSKEAVNV